MDETDPESVEFNEILEMVREGKMNEHYRKKLVFTCSRFKMGQSEFERRGFDDDIVSRLFWNNKEADNYNNFQINKQQTNKAHYIANITTENSPEAKTITERQANSLPSQKNIVCGFKMFIK